jgi:hypothetical protein
VRETPRLTETIHSVLEALPAEHGTRFSGLYLGLRMSLPLVESVGVALVVDRGGVVADFALFGGYEFAGLVWVLEEECAFHVSPPARYDTLLE